MMTRGKKDNKQLQLELVMLDQLVKANRDLGKIHKHINFNFIYEILKSCYAEDRGRPSIDSVVLFKIF